MVMGKLGPGLEEGGGGEGEQGEARATKSHRRRSRRVELKLDGASPGVPAAAQKAEDREQSDSVV